MRLLMGPPSNRWFRAPACRGAPDATWREKEFVYTDPRKVGRVTMNIHTDAFFGEKANMLYNEDDGDEEDDTEEERASSPPLFLPCETQTE